MKEEQKCIYYISRERKETVEDLSIVEVFRQKEI
jgi:HSP90 family molecular chaperone